MLDADPRRWHIHQGSKQWEKAPRQEEHLSFADTLRHAMDERGDGQGWIRESCRWVGPFLEQMAGIDGQIRWLDIDAGVVNAYVACERAGYSLSSRRHLVSAMRTLVRWALVTGRVETDIRAGILAPKRPPADVPRGLTAGQVAQILAAADRATGNGLRDYALVLLLWRLGLRAGEAAGLVISNGPPTLAGSLRPSSNSL